MPVLDTLGFEVPFADLDTMELEDLAGELRVLADVVDDEVIHRAECAAEQRFTPWTQDAEWIASPRAAND